MMEPINIRQYRVDSPTLGNSRVVWVQHPNSMSAESVKTSGVCVFLDGEYYLALVKAADIVDRLQRERQIPPLLVAYVSHIDDSTRRAESLCNPDFVSFTVKELLPWLRDTFDVPATAENVIAGLSLTGLSATHVALHSAGVFSRALCQSASFWWEEGRWLDEIAGISDTEVGFRITVGSEETKESVDHGKGLIQSESQVAATRRTRDALTARGHSMSYHEFPGGHDLASWREDLPESLTRLFEL